MTTYTPVKLDRDLVVDRTKVVPPDSIILNKPSILRVANIYVFEIENYNPLDSYDINFTHGSWTFSQGYIQYTTPTEYFGPVKLTIVQTKPPFEAFVLFDDGQIYTETGEIKNAALNNDGKWEFDGQVSDYEEDFAKNRVAEITPPIPTTRKQKEPIKFKDYSPQELFGDLGSRKIQKEDYLKKSGGVLDYYIPSEEDHAPNESRNFYKTKNNKMVFVPRNSNVTQSGGNVLDGYGEVGVPGSSLKVIKNADVLSRVNEWDLEIKLWELTAIVPDEIISLCITSINFQPILQGVAFGHTYLWEQVSGDQSTVTWLTPKNQKDVVIDLGGLKVDRVFRFWISKDTEYEKYYDIHLYGTPFERLKNGPHVGLWAGTMNNHLNLKVHECAPIVLSFQNIWNKQLRVNIVRNY